MPEKVKELEPPTGLARLALRGPIWIYRFGLGKLLGNRFLELTHIGRKSGLARHTVLEVVRYEPSSGTYYIAVGFGEHSDWYKNILANPHVEVQSGSGHFKAIAVQLSPEEAGEELVKYSHQHRIAFRELLQFMGYRVDGTDADTRALGQYMHMFALKPAESNSTATSTDNT
ncbi:MAG: nitroreductase family deazaflavin-dependent oxidoreductase [Anaerolineales bacterium]|jgi:deazaflavin-dependent oxidoreductase (nitroreductase family)